VITAGDNVAARNELILEIKAEGRLNTMYIPVVIMG